MVLFVEYGSKITLNGSMIVVYGSIFESFRNLLSKLGTGDKSLYKLFTCMMCMPTWVGFGLSYLLDQIS